MANVGRQSCRGQVAVGTGWMVSVGLLGLGLASVPQSPTEAPIPPDQAQFFEAKIRPVLLDKCAGCHGANVQMGGVRLDTKAMFRKGGDAGPLVVAGDPDKSRLIQVIRYTGPIKMPRGGKLPDAVIADFEAWVKMGAPWPNKGDVVAPTKPNRPLWSLKPVTQPAVPKVGLQLWSLNPIDAFVLDRMTKAGLKPSPTADRRSLIRRATYDLTGLPPAPAEVDAFLADKRPDAYLRVVNRLLNSPRYGERQARLWLDVARYADTKGYVFDEDRQYANAYTYRRWVIQAFNDDLPYDQFIVRQLAADRLPGVMEGDDRSALAALGFLTIGRRFLNNTQDIIDDRIDVTMRGLQGFTVACARCHDHKFDPIPTQDYYSLYGVFASSDEATIPISARPVREPWEAFNRKVAERQKAQDELVLAQVARLRGLTATLSDEVKGILQGLREGQLPNGDQVNKLRGAFESDAQRRLGAIQGEIAQLRANPPTTPEFAMGMVDKPNPGDGVIFRRGNPGNPGGPAPRRFLLALSMANAERPLWTQGSGRLELARSIASPTNPLTARVFVNRIWQQHFGFGIVRTPSDFGHQGEPPTHPELLDYLAATFIERGWSVKQLHRMIVLSATYRQSANVSPEAEQKDPENRLLSHMNRRRLDLEQMRDSLVMAAGNLNTSEVGGKSVDLWARPFTGRRAVYGFIERQNLPGIFRTFDFASPDSTSARRFMTTVPQQALFFMNSPFAQDQAKGLATLPEIAQAQDDAQRVRRLYRRLFDRLPEPDELTAALAYLNRGEVRAVPTVWQYGYGQVDGASFTPLANFRDGRYQVGAKFPDDQLGYIALSDIGGHPGHDAAHSTIRRWIAPETMTVEISGRLEHGTKEGDGVIGRLVASRQGRLAEWPVKGGATATNLTKVRVQKGDRLDFIVSPGATDAFDSYGWLNVIRRAGATTVWNSQSDFTAPSDPTPSRTALLAQALLMTNEFLFID